MAGVRDAQAAAALPDDARAPSGWPRYAWLAALLLSIVLVLWPDPPKAPLVGADGWLVSGAFVPTGPDLRQLPESLVRSPEARFWTTWTPERQAQPGRIESPVFVLPAAGIGVPVRGAAGELDVYTYVSCLATGESLRFAHARTNTDWAIATFAPATDWCAQDRRVRLVADVRSTRYELSMGSPFALSLAYDLKTSTAAAAAYLFLAWSVAAGLLWLCWRRLGTGFAPPVRAGLALGAFGLVGYGLFFAFHATAVLGTVLTLLVFGAGLWNAGRLFAGFRSAATDPGAARIVGLMSLWLGVALMVVAVHGLVDTNAGAWSPNARFSPARWSSDNQIPMRIGQMLAKSDMQDTGWMGPWSVADRPPLAYGWHAMVSKVFGSHLLPSDGPYLYHRYSWPMGVLLNTLWAPLVFLVARRASGSARLGMAVVAACLMSPFVLFNAGFVWPKLLAGVFGLAAAYLLFQAGRSPRSPLREDTAGFVTAALLSALALQSHGGAMFALPPMIVMAMFLRGMPTIRAMLLSAVVVVAILAPWMLYQRWVDPPANALVKFAFAGTFGFGEEQMGVWETIQRAYAGTTLSGWISAKASALAVILLGRGNQCGLGEPGLALSTLDAWRARDFFYVLPSMGLLAAGALVARLMPRTRAIAPTAPWILWGVLSVLLGVLLTLDCHLNHHQAYQAMLALHLGLLLVIARNRVVFAVAWCVIAAYGIGVWVLEPLRHFDGRWDASAWAAAVLSVLLAVWTTRRDPGPRTAP
ncbi:hypothetical protein [Arenimonas sp. MALMAid1274]|uniref:hypothetical protein n=1 Tax=Arenimonas sp. MALMAid1274 TaxID=3411630 RepID=UPI003BA0FEC1